MGDNIQHVTRELVTAPVACARSPQNIHADSLVYMISSLGINPHECEAMFEDIPTIERKANFVVSNSPLRRDMDLTTTADKQAFAKNMFLWSMHGGEPVLRSLRHGLAVSPKQIPRNRSNVPPHPPRRIQSHRGLPQPLYGPH